MISMKKQVRKQAIKSEVNKTASKPAKTGLRKSDPDYYRKIGLISAKKRKMTSDDFAEMARKSHPRKVYKGGRPPNED